MDWNNVNSIGKLDSAPDGAIIESIFRYVAKELSTFKGNSEKNENALTNELCKQLEGNKPDASPWFFHHQNIENETVNTSTDFAAFPKYEGYYDYALIVFEAKRLSSSLPKKREREYVIGEYDTYGRQLTNSGGIERFKNERHGADVDVAGIIGYIQTGSFDEWFEKINGWIQDEIESSHDKSLTWKIYDKLKKQQVAGRYAIFKSASSRRTKNKINFRHLWVDLKEKS